MNASPKFSAGPKTIDLVGRLDQFFLALLDEAEGDTVADDSVGGAGAPPVGFLDRLKLFDAGAKWVAVKNKVDPDTETDAFGKLRDRFHGKRPGSPRRSGGDTAARPSGNTDAGAADPGPDDDEAAGDTDADAEPSELDTIAAALGAK